MTAPTPSDTSAPAVDATIQALWSLAADWDGVPGDAAHTCKQASALLLSCKARIEELEKERDAMREVVKALDECRLFANTPESIPWRNLWHALSSLRTDGAGR